ncbi:uncharacterized protein B0H18DRAFT_980879, partial [Fomitopsis serialis]|uniref:uncharacterized protein n=1 Tax=Fomitopsis serialis TaxID=139415 RepID=UPI002007D048
MIGTLTTYIVNRGILSAVIQIALCATYLVSIKQNGMVWLIFHCAGVKIYTNSLLGVLNARRHVRGGSSHIEMSDFTPGPADGNATRCDIDFEADSAISNSVSYM